MSFYETQNYFINKLSLMFFQLTLFFSGKREFVLVLLFQLKKFKMKETKYIYIYIYIYIHIRLKVLEFSMYT